MGIAVEFGRAIGFTADRSRASCTPSIFISAVTIDLRLSIFDVDIAVGHVYRMVFVEVILTTQ